MYGFAVSVDGIVNSLRSMGVEFFLAKDYVDEKVGLKPRLAILCNVDGIDPVRLNNFLSIAAAGGFREMSEEGFADLPGVAFDPLLRIDKTKGMCASCPTGPG